MHADHSYFYGQKAARLLLNSIATGEISAERLHCELDTSTTPPISEWQAWAGNVEAGHFFVESEDELLRVRCDLLAQSKHARVLMRDACTPRALQLAVAKQTCTIHLLPRDWREAQAFVDRLGLNGLVYKGEGIPSISLKALIALLKQPRRILDGEEKCRILEAHSHKCAHCGSTSKLEFDHVHRLRENVVQDEFQPLCKDCHNEKTRLEPKSNSCVITSVCNPQVWKH